MRMFLTDGMFGRCLEQIGPEFEDFQEAMKELYTWKNSEMNKKLYKIEKYDRIISNKEKHETAIDFGDYSYFMLLTNCEDRDVKTVEEK